MGLFDIFRGPDPDDAARQAEHERRLADIQNSLRTGAVPTATRERMAGARSGKLPWIATLTPAELMIARSHGIRPIASVSATCWLHYGWSWTQGHAQGWEAALKRLREEAKAGGANAVLDVKMRTLPLNVESSMDFTLVGTAVYVEGLPPSKDPIVATVPALEFVKLLEADVVPCGIAIGAQYDWLTDWRNRATRTWMGNVESTQLSGFWDLLRQRAHAELRTSARPQGNGVLAHINFSQMFEFEGGENKPKRFLGRHIVIATTVDARRSVAIPHEIKMVVDMHAGKTPLTGTARHHQSYATNDKEGAI
jgi:hypothetical protein